MYIYEYLYSVYLGFIISIDRYNINLNILKI